MEKDVAKIVVTYDDGSSEEIKKGCIVQLNELPDDKTEITTSFVGMRGADLKQIVFAFVDLGRKMGLY